MARQIIIRDTTLREGIQVPGSQPSTEQKQRFITFLDEIGVPEIEIGLPDGMTACAGMGDFIRGRGYGIEATALVPCYVSAWRRQVDLAAEHGLSRIDVLAPVSDCLLKERDHYGLAVDEIVPRLEEVLAVAGEMPLKLGVGLVDACRAPADRVLEIAAALGELGAERLVIYDSVGTMLPSRMAAFVAEIRACSGLPILVHCHNDYGMAAANSLAAVEGGAVAIDAAVNGIGGRAGNAAMEQVVVALENLYGLRTGIQTDRLRELSAFVAEMTGLPVSKLQPVVGDYCFAHLPVMHIRCIAGGNPSAFEPFDPVQVGAERTFDFSLPVSHAASVEPFIEKSGCEIAPEDIPALVATLRNSGDRGLTEAEVLQIVRDFRTEGSG